MIQGENGEIEDKGVQAWNPKTHHLEAQEQELAKEAQKECPMK